MDLVVWITNLETPEQVLVRWLKLFLGIVQQGRLLMFFPFFIFSPADGSSSTKRRAAQSFSVISVITGSETVVTKTALADPEDRRIADYRKSPLSRLLILND